MIEHFPVLLIVVPLLAAPVCVLFRSATVAYFVALIASVSSAVMSWYLLQQVKSGDAIHYDIGGWEPPYGIEYVVDQLSAFVLTFIGIIASVVLWQAPKLVRREIAANKIYLFYATYLLCLTGLMGMVVTGDLFNVFVFLEISSLSSYALIALGKNRRAPLAAFRYLILGSVGATFILIGIGLLYQMTGTLNMADIASRIDVGSVSRTKMVAFAFLTVGLCIKMAVYPLHTWLPDAYTYSPTVVSSFIAATSTKVSVYAFIRVIFGIITPQFAFATLPLDVTLQWFALLGIFVASAAAVFQSDVKRLLAYSSVAQLGYMMLGISLFSAGGLSASIVHLFNHAIIKGGLFMSAGCLIYRLGSSNLSDWAGAGRTMPISSLLWTIGGLGLIGVPLTAGFVTKWMLLGASMAGERYAVAVLMLLSSLLAVAYVWRVVETLYFATPSEASKSAKEVPMGLWVPAASLILSVIVFGVYTKPTAGLADAAATALQTADVASPEPNSHAQESGSHSDEPEEPHE